MILMLPQLHVEVPAESGGSNITQYLVDVDTVSTFSSTSLVSLTVEADEVRPAPYLSDYPLCDQIS